MRLKCSWTNLLECFTLSSDQQFLQFGSTELDSHTTHAHTYIAHDLDMGDPPASTGLIIGQCGQHKVSWFGERLPHQERSSLVAFPEQFLRVCTWQVTMVPSKSTGVKKKKLCLLWWSCIRITSEDASDAQKPELFWGWQLQLKRNRPRLNCVTCITTTVAKNTNMNIRSSFPCVYLHCTDVSV